MTSTDRDLSCPWERHQRPSTLSLPRLRGREGRGPAASTSAQASHTCPLQDRFAIRPPPQAGEEKATQCVLAAHPRPSFAKDPYPARHCEERSDEAIRGGGAATATLDPLNRTAALDCFASLVMTKGKRNADRCIVYCPRHANECCHSLAFGRSARSSERAHLSAFHRGSCLGDLTPPLSFSTRFLGRGRLRLSQSSEAPRRPVMMPAGRVAEAARERGYEPRPRVPHSLRHSAVTGDVPYASEIRDM